MDAELIFWLVVFVGGYALALGWLLRIVLRNDSGNGSSRGDA